MNQGFVGVDNLFEVDILFRKAGKGSIFVELRIEVVQDPLSEWRLHSEHGIDAAGETASHGDEVNAGCGAGREGAQGGHNLCQMLMGKGLIDGNVVLPPAEMGRGSGHHSGTCGAGKSRY